MVELLKIKEAKTRTDQDLPSSTIKKGRMTQYYSRPCRNKILTIVLALYFVIFLIVYPHSIATNKMEFNLFIKGFSFLLIKLKNGLIDKNFKVDTPKRQITFY